MKVFTAHTRAGTAPVLVPEAFSWGAALFGALWLAVHRAWLPVLLVLCAQIALGAVVPRPVAAVVLLAFAWTLGLIGHDLRRWSLERRGFRLAHVVTADGDEAALARLLDHRPELAAEAAA